MSDENENENGENGNGDNGNGKIQFRRKDGIEKDGYICFPVETPAEEVPEQEEEEEHAVEEKKIPPRRTDITLETCAADPRFQQYNKTKWCYRMYLDYHRCRHLLGDSAEQCNYFYKCYRSICPSAWFQKWDDQLKEGTFPRDILRDKQPSSTPCP